MFTYLDFIMPHCYGSKSSAACILLMYAIAAAPSLVVAACGMDKGLKGRVTYRIPLRSALKFEAQYIYLLGPKPWLHILMIPTRANSSVLTLTCIYRVMEHMDPWQFEKTHNC